MTTSLTCSGKSFAARVAGSLLRPAEIPELITSSLEQYEAAALTLAQEGSTLASIRARLRANRGTCALFDTDRFRRHIEAAYSSMWERHEQGLPPPSFAVQPGR